MNTKKLLLTVSIVLVASIFVMQGLVYADINSEYKKEKGASQTTEGVDDVEDQIVSSNEDLLSVENSPLNFTVNGEALQVGSSPQEYQDYLRNINKLGLLQEDADPGDNTCDFTLLSNPSERLITPKFYKAEDVATAGGDSFTATVKGLTGNEKAVVVGTKAELDNLLLDLKIKALHDGGVIIIFTLREGESLDFVFQALNEINFGEITSVETLLTATGNIIVRLQ
ncbi:hypothetical protein ACFL2G_05370 [Candidatus Omnitrophota bacterium]